MHNLYGMKTIVNPVLKGFNPDPSIVRVEDDYYIATSTFEWFPGVQIHHSRDLVHWELLCRPLKRVSQLDMRGTPDSCGVWAPCLSYDKGTFYLVYSNVKSFDGHWKDTPNFLVTASDINGPWSDPIFLNAAGFDGSLFHDDDGCKWYTSMRIDHRQSDFFGGIIMQEFDAAAGKLVGQVYSLTKGTALGATEGPHLYFKDGYYYLLLAEGGTEYGHAATIMRARVVTGPYEVYPGKPLVTSRDDASLPLQKAGHGSLVETQGGEWYLAFLVGRPLTPHGRCILGRETALERVHWSDGWPVLAHGGYPRVEVPAPDLEGKKPVKQPERVRFDRDTLDINFQSLRTPVSESWCSLLARRDALRLVGQASLASLHNQSLVARRVQHYNVDVATALEFEPDTFQQLAGLVFYYNTGHYHYLHVTGDESGTRKFISIASSDDFELTLLEKPVDITGAHQIVLSARLRGAALQFDFSIDGGQSLPIGGPLDASILSDDYIRGAGDRYRAAFTGCFVGICCQDLARNALPADFLWFDYRELE